MAGDGIRWKVNKKAWKELNQQPGVIALVDSSADKLASRAGSGFVAMKSTHTRKHGVARRAVIGVTADAVTAQATDGILQRVINTRIGNVPRIHTSDTVSGGRPAG